MKELYMVTEVDSGKSFIFDSMENLLDKYKCVTEARVLHCIDTGESWKGLVFDLTENETPSILGAADDGFDFGDDA